MNSYPTIGRSPLSYILQPFVDKMLSSAKTNIVSLNTYLVSRWASLNKSFPVTFCWQKLHLPREYLFSNLLLLILQASLTQQCSNTTQQIRYWTLTVALFFQYFLTIILLVKVHWGIILIIALFTITVILLVMVNPWHLWSYCHPFGVKDPWSFGSTFILLVNGDPWNYYSLPSSFWCRWSSWW